MIELIPIESLAEIHEQKEYYLNELDYSQGLNTEENVWKYTIIIKLK